MSEQQHNCVSDGEEDLDESQIDHPIHNDADIRKNLFDEFDAPAKKTSSESSGREYMKAYLRVRPFSNEEIEANENQQCVEKESRTSVLMNAPKESFAFKNSTRAGGEISHRFSFTNVFDEETTQKAFFDETTLPLVTDFIHGQNCLVFTYGVTNSGKTYTIQGTPKDGGVLPRSLDVLFNSIEGKHYNRMNLKPRFCTDVTRLTDDEEHRENEYKNALLSSLDKETFDINALLKLDQDSTAELSKASCADESALHNTINCKSQEGEHEDHPSMDIDENISRVADDTTINVDAQGPVKFSVWVSFAEIYNETIYDLLEPCPTGKGKKRTTLRLGDDTNGNPYIKGLRDIYVSNADEAYKILKIGQKNQRIASTKLNQCSSRSHCIFSVKVLRVVDVEDPHVARVSRLSFVDLAGSERYSKTQSKGDRLKEAGNINTSLMTLGKCLEYLRYNQRNPTQPLIIPFRESKLTRLFQGFFCGKGRASMIVNVNMCASMFDETFHVMKFSAIAKKVTTRVSKPVDLPPPSKKPRALAPTPRSKPTRMSVPWANGALCTPAPPDDAPLVEEDEENEEGEIGTGEPGAYQQQLMDLVKALQEKLIEEKRKMQTLEVKIREEVCLEMAEQLVSIEKAYSERVKMEVTAVEEKCDRRIELLTQSVKKTRKRARIERVVEDDEEWVPSVFLHAEQTKVREKQQLISELNAKIAELRQEVKQLKESRTEETAQSEAVLELQTHLNDANEEVTVLKQMLEEAGEAFTEKEAEISKLKAALDEEEACIKKQDAALKHLTAELEKAKAAPKVMTDHDEMSRTKGALEVTMAKLADTEKKLETKDSMMKELVRTLEATREELARERSFVAQAFDNDEEMIRIKDELQKAEAQTKELEKNLATKDEAISSLKKVIEETEARSLERNSQAEETEKAVAEKAAEITALAKQLEAAKEEMHGTKTELEKITVEGKGKDSQIQLLTKEFNEKVSELEDATREMSDKVPALEDMKRQVLEKETELNKVKEENSKTTAELESTKKALEEKVEASARIQCEVYQTQASEALEKGNAEEITKQAARIKEMEEEIKEKAVELENAKSESARKISELEAELTECKKEMKKLQSGDALAELEQQLEESTKALDKKNSQVIARNNNIKRLEMSLAEKERLLAEMEKLPKEPNLRAKEELKTLRRRLVQTDKEKDESRELLGKKDEKLEEAKQELEKLKKDGDEKSAKFLRELQESRTELDEVKEDTKKKQEQIKSLKEKLDTQNLKNACLQTQLENEKRGLLEKEKAVQEAKTELSVAKSSSATELDEARKRLASTEEKVQELEDEAFTANETTSRIQDEVKRYEKEIVPGLENKVKTLEEELLHSGERAKEAEEKLEQELNEALSRLEKRNEEIEQKVMEINELREAIKTSDQEKFQELDKVYQDMMFMQKTIEERNKTIDKHEENLREANLKQGIKNLTRN
ncbi:hypothetical protein ACROYT_G020690 [Oculina patagonica]